MREAAKDGSGRRPLPLLHRILLALVVGLVALEVVARVVDATEGKSGEFYVPRAQDAGWLYQPHPYMGFVLNPSYEPAHAGRVEINDAGMRSAEMAKEKPPGVIRILCLGGSTTYGTGATANDKTYPAQLERLLNESADEGVRYEVGNCGVPGYSTVESLLNFELRLLEYDPDWILIYHAANDARPIDAPGFRPDYSHFRKTWTQA